MDLAQVAMITFSCVAANHLGLVAAIEGVIKHRLPIINCPKCFTYWSLMAYGMFVHENIFVNTTISFFCAYLAIWLNLLFGISDLLYNSIYDTLFTTTNTDSDGT